MFATLYLEHSVPYTQYIILSYNRVRIQCNTVIGTDSSAVLSVYLTKMYSYSSTEALALCLFSHRAPITPHCRGKATQSFPPRERLSPYRTAKPEYHLVKFSLKRILHVSVGIMGIVTVRPM